jgi:hypothetical protein
MVGPYGIPNMKSYENTLELIEPFVFLSYAKEDRDKVLRIYKRLKEENLRPWIDEHHLAPGSDWDVVVRRTIRRCRFFAVFLSSNSVNKRGYIQREIRLALDVVEELPSENVFIMPVRLEACDVPERLARWQWTDIFRRGGYKRFRATLIHHLGEDYQPPVPKRMRVMDLAAVSFEDSKDRLLFDEFLERDAFIYAVLGRNRYGISDKRILILRKDLPEVFLKLMQVVSTGRKISRGSMLRGLPSRQVYHQRGKELKFIEPVKWPVLHLHPRSGKYIVKADSRYWRFVSLYCEDPRIYLVGPMQPIVVEDKDRPKIFIMPIR